jgi:plasmid stabilization system protein ParE
MSRSVRVARRAQQDIAVNYAWLSERSRRFADRWQAGIERAIDGLAEAGDRHPVFDCDVLDRDIREMLHGRRRSVYRVFYELLPGRVVVHRVLHSSQGDPDPANFGPTAG